MFMGVMGTSHVPLEVSASNVTGNASGVPLSGVVTSDTDPNPVVLHGSGTYTYAWVHVSTSSGNTPSIGNASAENPVWSATVQEVTNSISTWRLTVTDPSTGLTATTTITVTLNWSSLS